MYEIKTTTRFEKDLKLIKKRGYDTKLLKEVIDILSKGEKLEEKYKEKVYFIKSKKEINKILEF